MIEPINNILEILCRVCFSNAGYLIKLKENKIENIAFYGETFYLPELLSKFLIEKHNSGDLEKEDYAGKAIIKKLNFNFPVNAIFIKKLYSNENNELFFVILLSSKSGNFKSVFNNEVKNILIVLTEKLKISGEENKQNSGISKSNKEYLLKHYRNFFDLLLEVSEDLIFILDRSGYFVTVNDFGAASLDYGTEEIIGKHFLEFVSPNDKISAEKAFGRLIENDKITTSEIIFLSKYGKEIIFEISGNSLSEDGRIAGVLGVGKNITQLRVFEEKINQTNNKLIEANRIISIERQRSQRQKAILFELNKMKSKFISNISHELRTPLASIIGFSETISSDHTLPIEMRNEFNDIILNEAKRLAKLINDVLDISKIENGELELNKIDADIVKILIEAVNNNKSDIEKKNIILSVDLPKESVILKVDEERISQVLNGLLTNAVKFTGEGGRISVSAHEFYKEFEISISDTGIGIPSKDLPNIFQKFYKVNRPGMEIPGTGLGLVFVKQIVDLHKGFITILSDVNKGTTVIFKLPKTSKT